MIEKLKRRIAMEFGNQIFIGRTYLENVIPL
jgi:hypothetical protein